MKFLRNLAQFFQRSNDFNAGLEFGNTMHTYCVEMYGNDHIRTANPASKLKFDLAMWYIHQCGGTNAVVVDDIIFPK